MRTAGGATEAFRARAVERQHLRLGVDTPGESRIPASEPGGDGLSQRRDSTNGRIAPELAQMPLERRPEKRGDQRARLPEGKVDGWRAGRDAVKQLG